MDRPSGRVITAPSESPSEAGNCTLLDSMRMNWWNSDFLDLMVRRWGISECGSVLDVGCGMGNWILSLLPHLNVRVAVYGVDLKAARIRRAVEQILARHPQLSRSNLHLLVADGNYMPFPDASFDVVTCQTFLMHQSAPDVAMREMVRVLEPGGTLVCVEPNSILNYIAGERISRDMTIEERVAEFEFWLRHQKGKLSLYEGYNSIGEMIPEMMTSLGLVHIQSYVSDKAWELSSLEAAHLNQQAQETFDTILRSQKALFDREKLLTFVISGGGSREIYESGFNAYLKRYSSILQQKCFWQFGIPSPGSLYLTSGRKP